MREFADELSWWSDSPSIPMHLDLSEYRDEVKRLREANLVAPKESDEQRLTRLYNEAISRVQADLLPPLSAAMGAAGLQTVGGSRQIEGWTSETYGGGATTPSWGIDTIASPWLAAAIGAVHRSQPATDLEDMAVVFVLALMTPEAQHTYMQEFERFRPGSLSLDPIIGQLEAKIMDQLPEIIAHFLTACREISISRS